MKVVLGLSAIMSLCGGKETSGLLAKLMIRKVFTALTGKAPKTGDHPGFITYMVLVAVLTLMLEHLAPLPTA